MALWEYKTITSGIHGFATPALLESFLNNLGKEEWEIINYQPSPTNPLAFTGLVRRPTQRDWTPPIIAAAPPPQQSHAPAPSTLPEPAHEPRPESASSDSADSADSDTPKSKIESPKSTPSLRPVRDTERDLDPEALAEEDDDADDEWDSLGIDDDLPTFFDALKPHMRNNQKGPGQSVAVDYLMKRWELRENEILGALKECGLTVPETEDADPEYFEFEDDLFWVNRNNRGQYFINTREKPRPVFRTVAATPLSPDDPAYAELAAERAEEKARIEKRAAERAAQQAAATARAEEAAKRRAEAKAAAEASAGNAGHQPGPDAPPDTESDDTAGAPDSPAAPSAGKPILDRIRPKMRRNRHGPGFSGSVGFLARALKIADADLTAELTALGLQVPAAANEKPTFAEIGTSLYWLNKDNRGNIWINARENKNNAKKTPPAEQPADAPQAPADVAQAAEPVSGTSCQPVDGGETAALGNAELPLGETTEANLGTPAADAQPAATDDAQPAPGAAESAPAEAGPQSPIATVRPLLKPNKSGTGVSGEVGYLARTLDQNETEFVASLTNAGLVVPPEAGAKPVFVEHEGEIFWFSFYEKDGSTSIWLNAKPAKSKKRPARTRRAKTEKAESEE